MKTEFKCLPCMMKTIFESIKLATNDELLQRNIFLNLVEKVKDYPPITTPPEVVGDLFHQVKEMSNNPDPYYFIKKQGNDLMLEHVPMFLDKILASKDSLLAALELSISGNIIDYGIHPDIDITQTVVQFLNQEPKIVENVGWRSRDCL